MGADHGRETELVQVFGANRIMWSSNYSAHPKFGGIKE
jgi:hypothetical protein